MSTSDPPFSDLDSIVTGVHIETKICKRLCRFEDFDGILLLYPHLIFESMTILRLEYQSWPVDLVVQCFDVTTYCMYLSMQYTRL